VADGVLTRKTLDHSTPRRSMLILAVSSAFLVTVPVLAAQTHEVTVDGETFRKTADGRRLADLAVGTRVQLLGSEGVWARVQLDGWVPSASLSPTDREGHDRVVEPVGGENLLDRPSGAVGARLLQGFLLDHVLDQGEWTQVQRTGWVRMSAIKPAAAASFARPADEADASRPPALVSSGRRLMSGAENVELHRSPDGDTAAVVRAGTPITVVERGNRWTRVRIEGWVRSDRLVTSDIDSTLVEVSAGGLRASPDEYRGMRLRWRVQFIALERAEPERTDFYEGEPFILARAPDPGDGFVYISVPPELLTAVESLEPLEMIDVLAQVRTGRSALMGVPVLDLLALF
jgi:hypothetical protein